ncbi:MAG: sulfurtransferase TusA family protein [Pseudomonadota bacterium]
MSNPIETLDALGLLCPLPVLKARKRLKSMPNGAVLKLLADDPAAIIDVPHFCFENGHRLLERREADGHQIYLIEKSG